MKRLSDFDGVLFDLGGVITDTAKYHFLGWKRLAKELAIPFSEADNEKLKGVDRMTSLEKLLAWGGKTASVDEKRKLAERKNSFYQESISLVTEADILPGVCELITRLRDRRQKISVASASQNAPALLKNLGLSHYFDHVADASLARSKPAPDIFLYAAYGVGLHPKHCVGIEDSIAGLKAIQSASMYAIGVGGSALGEVADRVVGDLTCNDLI